MKTGVKIVGGVSAGFSSLVLGAWRAKNYYKEQSLMYFRQNYLSMNARDENFDAFRHAYTSAVLTRDYGANVAEKFGNFNEILGQDNPPGEKARDLYNNAVGRKIAALAGQMKKLLKMLQTRSKMAV